MFSIFVGQWVLIGQFVRRFSSLFYLLEPFIFEADMQWTATGPSQRESFLDPGREKALPDTVLSSSMQMVLSMGFSYLQVIEAYSIFGDDVDSIVCYLLEMGGASAVHGRCKGKAAE